jgi:hypothetical protein
MVGQVNSTTTANTTVQAQANAIQNGTQTSTLATVAATGTNAATAAPITTGTTNVTGADGTKGVILPAGATGAFSSWALVLDNAAAVLKVYPPTGGTINGLSANAALSVAANCPALFFSISATAWFTLPLLPS